MEAVPLLKGAWRRRYRLIAAALVAAAAFVGLGGLKPATRVATASTKVALNTPKSQLVEVAPQGATTLPWRASLLTDLLATHAVTAAIAARLGVPARQVAVSNAGFTTPLVATAEVQAAATAASVKAPYVLAVSNPNGELPLISLRAVAASPASARRLAQSAIAVLRTEASAPAAFRSTVQTDGGLLRRQAFVVNQVAPIRLGSMSSGKLSRKAIAAALLVFLAVVGLGGRGRRLIARRRRRPSVRRRRLAAGT